jgi:hypothetical protein
MVNRPDTEMLTVIALAVLDPVEMTHHSSIRHDVPLLIATDFATVYVLPMVSVMELTLVVVVRISTVTTITSFA